jgi:hypothetical protein
MNLSHHEEAWGSGGIAPPFLTSILDGAEWSALPQRKEPPVPTGQEAEWVPNPVLDNVGKTKISWPGHPARSLPQYRLSYPSSDEMMYE